MHITPPVFFLASLIDTELENWALPAVDTQRWTHYLRTLAKKKKAHPVVIVSTSMEPCVTWRVSRLTGNLHHVFSDKRTSSGAESFAFCSPRFETSFSDINASTLEYGGWIYVYDAHNTENISKIQQRHLDPPPPPFPSCYHFFLEVFSVEVPLKTADSNFCETLFLERHIAGIFI